MCRSVTAIILLCGTLRTPKGLQMGIALPSPQTQLPDFGDAVRRWLSVEFSDQQQHHQIRDLSDQYEQVKINFTEIFVTQLSYDADTVHTQKRSSGVLLQVLKVKGKVLGKFHKEHNSWNRAPDDGYIRANITNGEFRLMKRGRNNFRCRRDLSLSLGFVSRTGWLYETLGATIQPSLKQSVGDRICQLLKKGMTRALDHPEEIPMTPEPLRVVIRGLFQENRVFTVNYTMGKPTKTGDFYVFKVNEGLAGKVGMEPFQMYRPPVPKLQLPRVHDNKSLILYQISDHTFNHILHILYHSNQLSFFFGNISGSQNYISHIFSPTYTQKWVQNDKIEFLLRTTKEPRLLVEPQSTSIEMPLSTWIYLRNHTGPSYYLLTVEAMASYELTWSVGVTRPTLRCEARLSQIEHFFMAQRALELDDSYFRSDPTIGFATLFDVVSSRITERMNRLCRTGLGLPYVRGRTLGDPQVFVMDAHFVTILAELQPST